MQKVAFSIALIAIFFSIVGLFSPVLAQKTNTNTPQGPCKSATEVWTAFGCISTDPQGFITSILEVGIGIGGGVAFLLILFGGFQILTSAGNPEQMNAGRELVTSAITGLLLIIFSVFLLRLIGVNILQIPKFG